MNNLEKSLKEIIDYLGSQSVPYMIVGGIANIVWGLARNTFDIDITIWVKNDLLENTISNLTSSFKTNIEKPLEFVKNFRVLPIQSSEALPIDIIFGGLPFERNAIKRALERDFGEIKVRVCSPEDLIIMKIISDRAKDREDVSGIIRNRGAELDREYLAKNIRELSEWLERSDILDFYEQCWKCLEKK